jgi:hypothetical protein
MRSGAFAFGACSVCFVAERKMKFDWPLDFHNARELARSLLIAKGANS